MLKLVPSKFSQRVLFSCLFPFLFVFSSSVNAGQWELGINSSANIWQPASYKRDKKSYNYPFFSLTMVEPLSNTSNSDYPLSLRYTSDSRRHSFFGSYADTRMKSSYNVGFLLLFPVEQSFERKDGRFHYLYYPVENTFGFGLGFRRTDTLTTSSGFGASSLIGFSERREIFSGSGPELLLSFNPFFGLRRASLWLTLSYFSMQGPYSLDKFDVGDYPDTTDGGMTYTYYPTVIMQKSTSFSKTEVEGSEFNLKFTLYAGKNVGFFCGMSFYSAKIAVLNYQTDTFIFSENPYLSDSILNYLVYSLDEALFTQPLYRQKFTEEFTRLYVGITLRFG